MSNKKTKKWIVWLYTAVLCALVIAGLVYCVHIGTGDAGSSVQMSASAEDAVGDTNSIELDDVLVPLGDAADTATE